MKNKRERNSQTEMAVAQESRLGILEPMQTAESSSSEFKLNDWETQVLKDKLPRQRILLRSILFGLDAQLSRIRKDERTTNENGCTASATTTPPKKSL
jgi:hypothetical protein